MYMYMHVYTVVIMYIHVASFSASSPMYTRKREEFKGHVLMYKGANLGLRLVTVYMYMHIVYILVHAPYRLYM